MSACGQAFGGWTLARCYEEVQVFGFKVLGRGQMEGDLLVNPTLAVNAAK